MVCKQCARVLLDSKERQRYKKKFSKKLDYESRTALHKDVLNACKKVPSKHKSMLILHSRAHVWFSTNTLSAFGVALAMAKLPKSLLFALFI